MKVDQGSFANVAFAKKSQDGLLYMKFLCIYYNQSRYSKQKRLLISKKVNLNNNPAGIYLFKV